ncbi:hypothetical protein LshimejAT787_1801090 [Lyophyllum shimeji]|uniref:F-box domain-containing protein n=1 Tax=Lyophyllum shimeji TaxID=47721 RepID=A0A9P3UU31_LYOSH|nr:hypothetical protein LshimejAT787_1801090 [Lyophyllum shimeji]
MYQTRTPEISAQILLLYTVGIMTIAKAKTTVLTVARNPTGDPEGSAQRLLQSPPQPASNHAPGRGIRNIFPLDPGDLLSLARTNKSLRTTLMARGALTVWKAVRMGIKAPDPPKDFSEPRWAELLFGSVMCECCGITKANKVHSIDFALRRRLCMACKKKNYLMAAQVSTAFPNLDRGIYDLVPYTDISWSSCHPTGKKWYWADDIYDVAHQWDVHQANVLLHLPKADEEMQRFREERIRFTTRVLAEAERFRAWSLQRGREQRQRKEDRWLAISAKFKELESVWTRIRPNLERRMMEYRGFDSLESVERV